jgi:predicted DCC family thiol-disulfide oxidoreductase YuxK
MRIQRSISPKFIYDPNCSICTRLKNFISFFDAKRKITFIPMADKKATDMLGSIPSSLRYRSSHLVLDEKRILSGGVGMVYLLYFIPGLSPIASLILSFPPALTLSKRIYSVLSRIHDSGSCKIG